MTLATNFSEGALVIDILRRDLRIAAATLSPQEARFLVDYYYLEQENRKRANNQLEAMAEEPHQVLAWLARNTERLEAEIRKALAEFSQAHPVGRWAESIIGIGPVISAGLLAHIDIEKAPTCGHIWNFAGLNPGQQWLGTEGAKELVQRLWPECKSNVETCLSLASAQTSISMNTLRGWATTSPKRTQRPLTRKTLTLALARRPWNADLKTLCWKFGESFVHVSGNPKSYYGRLYREKKAELEAANAQGAYAPAAAEKLARFKIGRDTEAFKHYSTGFLPPAHVHARAKRWVEKVWLSHWHAVAFEVRYGTKAPVPYAIAYLGHAHLLRVPNWDEPEA